MNKRQRSINARRAAFIRWLRVAAERERAMSDSERAIRDAQRRMSRLFARQLAHKFFSRSVIFRARRNVNRAFKDLGDRVRIRTVPTISTGQ